MKPIFKIGRYLLGAVVFLLFLLILRYIVKGDFGFGDWRLLSLALAFFILAWTTWEGELIGKLSKPRINNKSRHDDK